MIFNSISNQYNSKPKITNNTNGNNNQVNHLKRMMMIQSQRVSYLPNTYSNNNYNQQPKVFFQYQNSPIHNYNHKYTNLTPKKSLNSPHSSQLSFERQHFITQYPQTNSVLGNINQQLSDQTYFIKHKEALKRSMVLQSKNKDYNRFYDRYNRDAKSISSYNRDYYQTDNGIYNRYNDNNNSRSKLNINKNNQDRILQTQVTLNPMNQERYYSDNNNQFQRNRSRQRPKSNHSGKSQKSQTPKNQLLAKPIISSKINNVMSFLSPSKWLNSNSNQSTNQNNKVQSRNAKFVYDNNNNVNYQRPNSRIKRPAFDPSHHYFPVKDTFDNITRKPILQTVHDHFNSNPMSQIKSQIKSFTKPFPQNQRPLQDQAQRFFNNFKTTGSNIKNKMNDKMQKIEQNKVKSPLNLAEIQKYGPKPILNELKNNNPLKPPNIIQKLIQKVRVLDNEGKMITFGVIGIAILLVILQTIQ